MCGGWRRSRWQNVPANLLYDQLAAGRVHTHRVRQLLHQRDGRRPTDQPRPVGHGRPGGLRQAASRVLPEDRYIHRVLLHRVSDFLRERAHQVAPGGDAPLSQRAHYTRGHQVRLARRRGGRGKAAREENHAYQLPAGHRSHEEDQRHQVFG